MFKPLGRWLSPDRMKNGLTIAIGPKHRTEDSHEAVYWSRRFHERDGNIDQAGRQEHLAGQVPSDPQLLASVIRKRAPHAQRVVFETGPLSVWFYHALTAEGLRQSASMRGMPRPRSTWP